MSVPIDHPRLSADIVAFEADILSLLQIISRCIGREAAIEEATRIVTLAYSKAWELPEGLLTSGDPVTGVFSTIRAEMEVLSKPWIERSRLQQAMPHSGRLS